MRLGFFSRYLAIVLCLLFAGIAYAQQDGTLTGTVTDKSGGLIMGAQVLVTNTAQQSQHTVITNGAGAYVIPALPAGEYSISISAPGFGPYERQGIILRVAQTERIDAQLAVGTASTVVNVEAETSASIETDSAEVSGIVTEKQITQLVLNNRNFTQLVTLTPGVSNQTGQDEGAVGVSGNASYSINGGRTEYNNWEIDGGENLDTGSNVAINTYPNIDAIAETKVLTSNYGAQYGRNASGTIEVITKSGTTALHGDAFEFLRNDAFNARNFFATSVPEYKKHDFGAVLGGPVYIPHIYGAGKKKTFFFYSEEFRREIVPGATFNQPVPSNAQRTGDFSEVCPAAGSAFDPADYPACPTQSYQTYYPNNQVPVDPSAAALLTLLPNATSGSGIQSVYQGSPSQFTHDREELFRIDHEFNDKWHLFYRYIHDEWGTTTATPEYAAGNFPTVGTNVKGPGVSMVANLTTSITSSLLNEFISSYTTNHITLKATAGERGTFGASTIYNNGFNNLLPNYTIADQNLYGGGFTVGTGYSNWENSDPTFSYRDQLTKSLGRHTISIGAAFSAVDKNEPSMSNLQGSYDFSSTSSTSTGNGFADFLVGRAFTFQQQSAQLKYYNRYKTVEPFVQDDWHTSNKLTINAGLRLSLFGTYHDISKQSGNFDPSAWSANQAPGIDASGAITGEAGALVPGSGSYTDGVVLCNGTNGVTTSCMKGHLLNFAPRLGFAYDLHGDGKAVFRGGYGIFWEHTNGNESNSEALEGSAPLIETSTQYNLAGYNSNNSPDVFFPFSVLSIPTAAVWPHVQQYNLTFEMQLPAKSVLSIGYVGNLGTHLSLRRELNQIQPLTTTPYQAGQTISADDCNNMTVNGVPVSGDVATHLSIACGGNPNPFRPYLGLAGIGRYEDTAHSNYNGAQVLLRRYFGHLNGSVAYTYSHSLDDASDGSNNSELPNTYNINSSYASSNFDQRQLVEASAVYDLPFLEGHGLMRTMFGGWQLSDLTSFQTGTPFSVNGNMGDNAGLGNTFSPIQAYPDVVGNIHSKPASSQVSGVQGPRLYNAAAFAAPTGLTLGNAGRNILRIPNRTNFDLGLFKQFAVKDQTHFEFRAEAFNAFNHTQWSAVNNVACYGDACDSSNFLTPTAAHNPRILQLAGKFVF